MKKIKYIAAIAFIAYASASAANVEPNDTVLSVTNAKSVIITENANNMTITINGTDQDPQFKASHTIDYGDTATVTTKVWKEPRLLSETINQKHSSDSPWGVCGGYFNFGFVGALGQSEPMDVEPFKSFELSILKILGVQYSLAKNGSNLSLSFGVNWRNWRMTTPETAFWATNNQVWMWAYPAQTTPKFSRIKVFSMSLPLLWQQYLPIKGIDTNVSFTVGPIINFNTYGSVKTEWQALDGSTTHQFCKNIGQHRTTVDIYAALELIDGLAVYARYSPMKVLDKPSPQFSAISIGLQMGF